MIFFVYLTALAVLSGSVKAAADEPIGTVIGIDLGENVVGR
jgi:hypothetical protein